MNFSTQFQLLRNRSLFFLCFVIFNNSAKSQSKWTDLVEVNSHTIYTIQAMAKDKSGNIYAGLGSNVFKWDGSQWSELGLKENGLNANGEILTIAVDKSGNVYAGGSFKTPYQQYYVAKWDGTSWTDVGSSGSVINSSFNYIKSLVTDKLGNVYAAVGSEVYKWDGTSWTGISYITSYNPNYASTINCLAIDTTGNIYAAGTFVDINNKYFVAKLNGSGFVQLGSGVNALNSDYAITTIATDLSGNVYAENGTRIDPYTGISFVSKWTGSDWVELGSGNNSLNANSNIESITTDSSGHVYAAGDFINVNGYRYVAMWNGTSWDEIKNNNNILKGNGTIYSMIAKDSNNIYAAGDFILGPYTDPASFVLAARYVSHWNGNNWKELSSTPTYVFPYNLSRLAVDNNGGIYAASFYDTTGTDCIGKFGGSAFVEVGGGSSRLPTNAITSIRAIVSDASNNIYVAGAFKNSNGKYYVAKWDGNVWSELGTGVNALNANNWISSLAIDKYGNILAAGNFTNSNFKCYVARWNGTSWSEVGSGANALNANNSIGPMIVDGNNNIYVAGAFTNAGGYRYVAKWNGNTWSEIGSGSVPLNANADINCLATDEFGNVYAAGNFYKLFSPPADGYYYYVAKWDGVSWGEVGTDITSLKANWHIYSLLYGGSGILYAAGGFTDDPQASFGYQYVAKWGGVNWTELGIGIDSLKAHGNIWALLMDNSNNIYATGDFRNSRGLSYVAKYHDMQSSLPVRFTRFTANCVNNGILINWTTASESNSNYFDLQRSTNSNSWISIAVIKAAGNSSSMRTYQQIDRNGGRAYYRIKQVDMDGHFIYTNIVSSNCSSKQTETQVYPIPAKDILNVHINSEQSLKIKLQVIDGTGKIVRKIEINLVNGDNSFQVDLKGLAAGEYYLSGGDTEINIKKKFFIIK